MSFIKRIVFAIILIQIGVSCGNTSNPKSKRTYENTAMSSIAEWFTAWELVSEELSIPNVNPVDFIFFDRDYVYSNSDITIENGNPIDGPSINDSKIKWKRMRHNGFIVLPNSQKVPLGIMSFAAPLSNNASFFIMPLPSFWKDHEITSKELGFDNMLTGIFVHEYSHSQQMTNFGNKISKIETTYQLENFSDDFIQNTFETDSVFVNHIKNEIAMIQGALSIENMEQFKAQISKTLEQFDWRQKQYYTDEISYYSEIEDLFLTMEGSGQYLMYKWLIHPNGANLDKKTAIDGVRRGGRWWSQDQGLLLFLVLDKLQDSNPVIKELYSDKATSVLQLININNRK